MRVATSQQRPGLGDSACGAPGAREAGVRPVPREAGRPKREARRLRLGTLELALLISLALAVGCYVVNVQPPPVARPAASPAGAGTGGSPAPERPRGGGLASEREAEGLAGTGEAQGGPPVGGRRATGLPTLSAAGAPPPLPAPPPGLVWVFYPRGQCESGRLEVQVWDPDQHRWVLHPTHPHLRAGSCVAEDPHLLLDELRVRCVDPARARPPSPWQVGARRAAEGGSELACRAALRPREP